MSHITSGEATAARAQKPEAPTVKQCCAAAYANDAARILLGDSFHPGGTKLTEHLGRIRNLTPRTCLLDVASGRGTSAIFLAERFGFEVGGVDCSHKNIEAGHAEARVKGLSGRVTFQCADAERLPFPDASFGAVICECAFCTLPNKDAAAREFNRVLRSRGQVGLSDLTRDGVLAPQLESLVSWIACIADVQSLSQYVALLSMHNSALADFVSQIRTRLLAAEVMARLRKLVPPGVDFEAAKSVAKHALAAIREGNLGYAIIVASKLDQLQAFTSEAGT